MVLQVPGNSQLCIWELGPSGFPDLSSVTVNYVVQVEYLTLIH